MRIKPSILPGFLELLPEDQVLFEILVGKIRAVYERFGFLPMDTPVIEKSEVLLAKSQGETSKQVYRFMQGDKDLTLRYDLTVPFARFIAMHAQNLVFPFKRYQIGKVYRGERNQKGRYKEFYQCDIDIVGRNELALINDGFVIYVISEVFKEIGLQAYRFCISNRKLMKGLIRILQLEEEEGPLLNLLDKYAKLEREVFYSQLEALIGRQKKEELLTLLEARGDQKVLIRLLKGYQSNNEIFDQGLKEIEDVLKVLALLGVRPENYQLDLCIIRGLDYYTGTVFETILQDREAVGSICSGGRYEALTECFSNEKYPGVGISIGLTRLFVTLKEMGFFDKSDYESKKCDYYILSLDEDDYAIDVFKQLKQAGYLVWINFEQDGLKKKLNDANKRGAQKVIIIGEKESCRKVLLIKDMRTGDQEEVQLEALIKAGK